ncbi:MAG: hypothetical protein JSW40_08730 [Candidatus Omnitrophota bacterium]|nr:MAG: hypothetical protein JSW40_08730 [Candidatus Omnitrophota bacterium]
MHLRVVSLSMVIAFFIGLTGILSAEDQLINDIVEDTYFQKIISYFYRSGVINDYGIARYNIQSPEGFKIWHQQICWDAIVAGIGKEREQDIRRGLKAIRYGFENMRDDGSFENSSLSGTVRFLFACAKSYQEIKNSRYKDKYIREFDSYIPQLRKATLFVLNSPEWRREAAGEPGCTNREIGLGLAAHLLGIILEYPDIIKEGNTLFYQGVNKQTEEGIFPEKDGYDSSYQATSLQFIALYYLYVADDKEREQLLSILRKGWQWELSRIESSGKILIGGNTRTGWKQEVWRGKYKEVNYPDVALSLIYWSHISGDKSLRKVARNIFEYAIRHRR